jgi:electron transport complex protein RnfB
LGELLDKDPTPFIADMALKAKSPSFAFIREAECIGCTKCIQACPVDAIMGTGKWMHTVMKDECTGCELCIAPCPVDCIEMVLLPQSPQQPDYFRKRYLNRQTRLEIDQKMNKSTHETENKALLNKKEYINSALERIKFKKY